MTSEHMEESGGISPAGRFARMEAALERIESKLDSKADQAALDSLDARVGMIETQGTPRVNEFVAAFKKLEQHVSDLETGRASTPQAIEFIKQHEGVLSDIAKLKNDAVVNETRIVAAKETVEAVAEARFNSMKLMLTVVSTMSGVAVVVSSLVTALSLLHVIK